MEKYLTNTFINVSGRVIRLHSGTYFRFDLRITCTPMFNFRDNRQISLAQANLLLIVQ